MKHSELRDEMPGHGYANWRTVTRLFKSFIAVLLYNGNTTSNLIQQLNAELK